MRKQLVWVLAVGTTLALIVVAAAAGERKEECAGNLCFADNGGISPSKLPRHGQAPISAHVDAELWTRDRSHPPAARTVALDLDRTLQVDAKGLPTCRKGQLVARSSTAAKRACPKAIVGSGKATVQVAFKEQKPFEATGPLVVFNGGVHGGKTLLLVHAYVAVPTPTAIVTTTEITHIHRGHFGLHTVTQIPPIAGGAGSLTRVHLEFGRRFGYRGKRESYLTASCPTGHYFTEGEIHFSDGTKLGLTHILPCTPRG